MVRVNPPGKSCTRDEMNLGQKPLIEDMKMKPTKTVCLALIMLAASSLTALAESEARCAPEYFKLRVKAALTRIITPTKSPTVMPVPSPITFVGKGKAKADARGVTIEFAVLDATGQRGKAKIRVNNPLKHRRGHRYFAGHGAAKVQIGDSNFAFRLRIKGKITRREDGRLLLHGKFASHRLTRYAARFSGRFGGINLVPVVTD